MENRLAALSADGLELTLWNVDHRQRLETISLADVPKGSLPEGTGRDPARAAGAPGRRTWAHQWSPLAPEPAGDPVVGAGRGRQRWFMGNRLALAGQILTVIRPADDGLRLFDLRTGSPLSELDRPGRRIMGVLASPAGERLLTIETASDATRRLPPGQRPLPTPGFPQQESEIEFVLWDLNQFQEPVAILEKVKLEPMRRSFPIAAFSPEGKTVAVSSIKNATATVTLYGTADGQPTNQIDTQAETLTSLALGANNVMATASGNTIQLWDREAGTILTSLSSNREMPWVMRFNPQGTLLATAWGNQLELWDAVSHKILAALPTKDLVTDLCFTPDGRTLAVAGRMDDHLGLAGRRLGSPDPARRFRGSTHVDGIRTRWKSGHRHK